MDNKEENSVEIKLSKTAKILKRVVIVAFIFFILIFIGPLIWLNISTLITKMHCTESVKAVVTDTDRSVSKDSDGDEHYYSVPVFKYTIDGTEYITKSKKTENSLSEGDEIVINYNPDNPEEIWFSVKSPYSKQGKIVGLGFICFAVFIIFKNLKCAIVYKGKTNSVVTGRRTVSTKSGPEYQTQIKYTVDGVEYNTYLPETTTVIHPDGTEIPIRYKQNNPSEFSTSYGKPSASEWIFFIIFMVLGITLQFYY